MRHQYRTKGFWKKYLQRFVDFFIDLYAKIFVDKSVSEEYDDPKNILFVSLGHLGDALIGSYLFPLIRESFPNAELDVLTSEWCKPVLQNNPYVRNLIYFNHFRMNRSEISWWKKIRIHINSSRNALKAIRSQQYDLSIEGRISHPNGNLICYRGRIKRRIGFGSGGFGSLLTDEVPFPSNQNFHMLDAILGELKLVGINKTVENIKPYFNLSNQSLQMTDQLEEYIMEPFIILHVETGKDYLSERLISEDFWLEIVRIILSNSALNVIVCGTTKKSSELFKFLQLNLGNADGRILNMVDKLSLDEFFLLSRQAIAAVTVDSLAAHFCAINCDTISCYKNGFGALYFPISNNIATVIHNHQPSKDIKVNDAIMNYYVSDIESKHTYILIERIIINVFKTGKTFPA